MKPLTILHTEWSDGWGGQEIRILAEMAGMAELGHRMLLAAPPQATILQRARERGFTVFPLPMPHNMCMLASWRLARLVRQEKVDFLHTHSSVDSWLGGWAKHLFRCPAHLVRTRHIGRIKTNPLNFIYKMPAHVITTGDQVARDLVEGYGLAADRVTSIGTGVDARRFAPAPPDPELARELGLDPAAGVVGMVAVLRSWKRHDLFCQMAKMLLQERPQTRFLIVGGGPGWQRVNGYLDELGLRPAVLMTNHREDVDRLLSLIQVVVLTSEESEGSPQSLSQALAAEKAVVAVDKGSITDLIRDGETGFIVPFGDLAAMTAKVRELLDNPGMARQMGAAGRRLVLDTYTMDHTVAATLAVYQKVLEGAGRAA